MRHYITANLIKITLNISLTFELLYRSVLVQKLHPKSIQITRVVDKSEEEEIS
jgi:hypothetical protein